MAMAAIGAVQCVVAAVGEHQEEKAVCSSRLAYEALVKVAEQLACLLMLPQQVYDAAGLYTNNKQDWVLVHTVNNKVLQIAFITHSQIKGQNQGFFLFKHTTQNDKAD
jgi:hypothetical protein